MTMVKVNEATAARRRVLFFCADDDSADSYAPKTGLTFSAGELKVSKTLASEANAVGTVTELGGGFYVYEFTAGEVDTLGVVGLRVAKTDVYSEMVQVMVVAFDPFAAAGLGLTNLDATVSSRLASASYEAPSSLLDLSDGIESGITVRQGLRAMAAMLTGLLSGARSGTETFRGINNGPVRVIMTVDASGNRTSIALSL
jgi:hypothetical protein